MKKFVLTALAVLVLGGGIFAFILTRDGERTTPEGEGAVALEAGTFEGFPLPDYAAKAVSPDFKSYLVEVEPGIKIHVLEVGSGYPVYLQHGNPTNGLLYRKIAAELPRDKFRLIMPTMVGLGFSSKIPASEHTLDNHIRWTGEVLKQLKIEEMIYVGQDWGGAVGMGVAARAPDLLKGTVVMNTGLIAPTEKRALSSAHATVKTPVVGEILLEGFGSIFTRLSEVQGDPASMPEEVIALYARPIDDGDNGKAPLALMRMVPDGPDHPSAEQMREIEAYVDGLDVPAALVWGMKDPILGQGLEIMQTKFPAAPVTRTDAGHFLQEEVPAEIAAAIEAVHAQIIAAQEDDAGPSGEAE